MRPWYHRAMTALGAAALVSCQADLIAPTGDHPVGPQLTGGTCSSEVGESVNQDLQGELYGFLYSGTNKVCLADFPDGSATRLVLTPLSGSGPAGWDNTFYLVPHANELDGAYNWNDVLSTDPDGCFPLDGPMPERHTGSLHDGVEHHCIVAGRYRVSLQVDGVTIQRVDLDYIQAKAQILGEGGRLVMLADESFATTGYLGGDHIIIFNVGAAVPDVAVNEGFEADAPGIDPTLAGWAPMPPTDLVVATNEALRVDVGQTTAPGALWSEYGVLHRITWESGDTTGWFYSDIGFNHTRAHVYGGAPRCKTLVHEVALPGDFQATGVAVPAVRRFSRTVDIGGGCGSPHPDLKVQSITAPGALPSPWTGSVSVNVLNSGTGASTGGVVRLYLSTTPSLSGSPTQIGQATLGTVGASGTAPTAITATIPSGVNGTRYLVAVVDADRTVAELHESNNTGASAAISIAPIGDLVIDSIQGPASMVQGAVATFPVFVRNLGPGAAAPGMTKVYLSTDSVYGTGDLAVGALNDASSLGAGAARTENVSVTIPSGQPLANYYVIARIDADSTLYESNEGNNNRVRSGTLSVNGYPDLQTTLIKNYGDMFTGALDTIVAVGIFNAGSGTAASGWTMEVYISRYSNGQPEYFAGSTTINTSLAPSGTIVWSSNRVIATVPCVATGTYYIAIFLDSGNVITESDEMDNHVVVGPVTITRNNGCTIEPL